jgi:alpha-galactosidase
MDGPVSVAVLPEHSAGWLGTPGPSGHRDGTDFSTAFQVTAVSPEAISDPGRAAGIG